MRILRCHPEPQQPKKANTESLKFGGKQVGENLVNRNLSRNKIRNQSRGEVHVCWLKETAQRFLRRHRGEGNELDSDLSALLSKKKEKEEEAPIRVNPESKSKRKRMARGEMSIVEKS
jgi:hypothetical protein